MAKIPRRAQPPAESSEDESEHEPTPSVKKRKSKTSESKPAKGKKKAQSESEEDDDSEEEEVKPRSKKVQKQKKESDVSSSGPLKQDGDMKYVDLGGKKRASASEFKGQRYINIREYYVDKASGEEKPGKKGIALNAEQWKVFKQNIDTLDELFASK